MNGMLSRRIIVTAVAVALAHAAIQRLHADDTGADATPTNNTVDPFIEPARADEALIGIWQYSADFVKESRPVTYPPQAVARPGQPPATTTAPPQDRPPSPADATLVDLHVTEGKVVKQNLSSSTRLDLKKTHKYRMELLVANHNNKSGEYAFVEGTWKLSGRLLVLTFSVDGEVDRWIFLIDRLSDKQLTVRSVGDSEYALEDGQGTLRKSKSGAPLVIPKGYQLDVTIADDDKALIQQATQTRY